MHQVQKVKEYKVNKLQKAIAIRNQFKKEYENDSHLVEALCIQIVDLIDNYDEEREWFETVIFKEGV